MSIRQMVFAFLDSNFTKTNKLEFKNKQLYTQFPKESEPSLRTYGKQWYKSKLPKIISKTPDIPQIIYQPPPAAITKPTKLDTQHITDTIVEQWIIRGDPRAKLGLEYLQRKDQFSKVEPIIDDYKAEFKELLTSEC